MSKTATQFHVSVDCYDDRGDPYPPNNWMCSVYIDGIQFTPYGCTTKRKARAMGRKVAKALGVEPEMED